MRSIKRYIVPIFLLVVIGVLLWLGFDGLSELQDANPDYTFWDNVVANFEANVWVKVVGYSLLASSGAIGLGTFVKNLR